jgi:hypothetical protein
VSLHQRIRLENGICSFLAVKAGESLLVFQDECRFHLSHLLIAILHYCGLQPLTLRFSLRLAVTNIRAKGVAEMFKRLPAFLLVIASLFIAKAAHAQLTEAALKGAVTDPGGYGIVASQVNVKNESTGEERSTKTDSSATFTITALSPGTYKIMVTAAGFKTFEQSGIKLSVGLTTDLHIRMEVGELSQTVEVHANAIEAPVAMDGRLADNLQQQKIVDLPLANRDVFGLLRLSAGATIIPGAALSTKLTNSPVVTVNGNRYRGNNYVLDGSMNTNPNNTGEPAIVPSLESVEEVQVQTGNFSGEFGRGNGAVVNLRTKSGTNLLHGAVWEYNRNAALSAKNFFAVGQKPPLVFNQFGGTLGGPIAKDKTFFFASYEGTRNAAGQALNLQVETPEFREFVSSTNPSSIAARLTVLLVFGIVERSWTSWNAS